VQRLAFPAVDISECGVADADGFLQHGLKNGLQITRRAADDLQHLRCGGLLLKGLAQFIQEPRVLDGDNGLSGEILDKSDLPVGKRKYPRASQHDHSNDLALAFEGHAENGAESPRLLPLGESIFRVSFHIGNLNRFAAQQDPSGNRAPPRRNWVSLGNLLPFLGEAEPRTELHHAIPVMVDCHQLCLA
jgi:hypothetical protein